MTFGEWLRSKRHERKLTLQDVGDIVGVPKTTVSKWERDACIMTIRFVGGICKALNISPEELIEAWEKKKK